MLKKDKLDVTLRQKQTETQMLAAERHNLQPDKNVTRNRKAVRKRDEEKYLWLSGGPKQTVGSTKGPGSVRLTLN